MSLDHYIVLAFVEYLLDDDGVDFEISLSSYLLDHNILSHILQQIQTIIIIKAVVR